jgi:transposase
MSRHSACFKRSVVDCYLLGDESYASTGAVHGVDAATVRKWVALYRAHGAAGLAKKFSHYDAAFKLSVLRRMWEDGLSCREAAAAFNIRNAACLPVWERLYETGGIDALRPRRRGRPRLMPPDPPEPQERQAAMHGDEARSREELLAELSYLRMENAYLKKLEALTRDRHAPRKRKPSRR